MNSHIQSRYREMLQIRTHRINLPEQLQSAQMHGIVSRNTLFGFHRRLSQQAKLVDRDCSKSMLWITSDESIANYMVNRLREDTLKGLRYHHLDDQCILQRERATSLMPLAIEQFSFGDLQKICTLHHFDLFIAESLTMADDIHVMSGYEYVTHTFPQRDVIEKYMHDMLYKKNN